jgi:hypothetical protein
MITNALTTQFASGFLLQASNSVYLVTARHVLFAPVTNNARSYSLWSPCIECRSYHAYASTNTLPVAWQLDLAGLMAKREIRWSTDHDVALVRMEDVVSTNRFSWSALPETIFITSNKDVTGFAESRAVRFARVPVPTSCYTLGFPSSIGVGDSTQLDKSKPLMRKGIVAGINDARGTFVLDCPVYAGDSGGPVVITDPYVDHFPVDYRFYVIGIQVEFVRVAWPADASRPLSRLNANIFNSGYSIAEPMDTVLDLLWK